MKWQFIIVVLNANECLQISYFKTRFIAGNPTIYTLNGRHKDI